MMILYQTTVKHIHHISVVSSLELKQSNDRSRMQSKSVSSALILTQSLSEKIKKEKKNA